MIYFHQVKEETIQDLKDHNKHLTETLNRTVEALLAFQEYQETYRKTCLELKTDIKEAEALCTKLQTDINTQVREEKYWKRRYETRDIVSPPSQEDKNERSPLDNIMADSEDAEVGSNKFYFRTIILKEI